jgi:SAM-dependent methyltransferase
MNLPYGKLLSADAYAEAYAAEADFEPVCIAARQQTNAAFLAAERPATILEVGCGPSLLSTLPGVAEAPFRRWTIVEPAPRYAQGAREALRADGRFAVVQAYLEAGGEELRALAPEGYEAAVVSGLIHETSDPTGLLTAVLQVLKPGGKLLVSAPNALSFHRLLAVACGLIPSPYELSALDLQLGHPTVFDPQSLALLVQRAGASVVQAGGALFKPFTNAQMHEVVGALGPHLIPGLIELGRQFPANAAEIFVVGQKPVPISLSERASGM